MSLVAKMNSAMPTIVSLNPNSSSPVCMSLAEPSIFITWLVLVSNGPKLSGLKVMLCALLTSYSFTTCVAPTAVTLH